jgi:dolichyl-phosphate beta-glucosyltransferase
MGKGYSIRRGMLEASGDYILFIDVDMSTPLSAFSDFEKYLDHYDIVMGSRWMEESNIRIHQPRMRRMFAKVFYAIVRAFFLKGIIDTNCGFKCYRRAVAKDIFSKQRLNSWGFDVELLYIAKKRGYGIKEVPVIWAHGRDSKVNLLTVPLLTLAELAAIKVNDWKGRYGK